MTSGLGTSARTACTRGTRSLLVLQGGEAPEPSHSSPPLLGLFDRHGRFWEWSPERPRYLGAELGVFQYEDLSRTEREIEAEAEPVIEVRDTGLMLTRLEPVPAARIGLGETVLLPGTGMLSQVIGLFDCAECSGHHERCLFVCTDNDDWVHRSASSPVLSASSVPPRGQRGEAIRPALRLV